MLKLKRFQFKFSKVGVFFFYSSADIMEQSINIQKIKVQNICSLLKIIKGFSLETTKNFLKRTSN